MECLIAVAPEVGLARVVSAAPELALALGYDVDAALEAPGEPAARPNRPNGTMRAGENWWRLLENATKGEQRWPSDLFS